MNLSEILGLSPNQTATEEVCQRILLIGMMLGRELGHGWDSYGNREGAINHVSFSNTHGWQIPGCDEVLKPARLGNLLDFITHKWHGLFYLVINRGS